MRFFKLIGISFLVFFCLFTAVGLFFPSQVQVSRALDLPGQRKSDLIRLLDDLDFRRCLSDSTGVWEPYATLVDSLVEWKQENNTRMSWIFHGLDGQITLQARVSVQLGWLPWQRFRSLLMEPRYGPWLEKQLEKFKRCLDRSQLVRVSP